MFPVAIVAHSTNTPVPPTSFHTLLLVTTHTSFVFELTAIPAGDAVVVEAPWHLESNWNALPLYQAVHRQRIMVGFVGGVCADDLYGELRQDIDGLGFSNFTPLQKVLDGRVKADYLVFRSQGLPGSRVIQMDFEKCERLVRAALGEPWRMTETAQVFRIFRGS